MTPSEAAITQNGAEKCPDMKPRAETAAPGNRNAAAMPEEPTEVQMQEDLPARPNRKEPRGRILRGDGKRQSGTTSRTPTSSSAEIR